MKQYNIIQVNPYNEKEVTLSPVDVYDEVTVDGVTFFKHRSKQYGSWQWSEKSTGRFVMFISNYHNAQKELSALIERKGMKQVEETLRHWNENTRINING